MKNVRFSRALCLIIAAAVCFSAGCADKPSAPAVTADAVSFTHMIAAETPEPSAEPTPEPTPSAEELIDAFIAGMSIEDKLGQLVMFGFIGTEMPDAEFLRIAEEYRVGNVLLNGSNILRNDGSGGFVSASKLLENLGGCGIARFCAADVEGGTVTRFSWEPELPSARALGRLTEEEVRAMFENAALRLRETGINVDLAPVMDASHDPMSTALGSRIIASDTDKIAEIGGAVIEGLHAGGCLSAAKHFPGHGGTRGDSHELTPVVDKSYEELWEYDLAPFRAAVSAGVDFVMVAHVLYPALDPDDIASMSEPVIGGILRGEMGFDGIVISDDMLMQGLLSRYGAGDAAVKFIKAGGDMILCGADYAKQKEIMTALYSALEAGELDAARIDLSVKRILTAKYRLGIWAPIDRRADGRG